MKDECLMKTAKKFHQMSTSRRATHFRKKHRVGEERSLALDCSIGTRCTRLLSAALRPESFLSVIQVKTQNG